VDWVKDFEDMLALLERHRVKYLIVGGLAFVFHAKPRYTKDLDLWLDPDPENIERANRVLVEFGAPYILDPAKPNEILQIGVAPDRIDLIRETAGVDFGSCWNRRVRAAYGTVEASWIDLDGLLDIKSRIDDPRHQADARTLRMVKERRQRG
jgi:hypothetical protein